MSHNLELSNLIETIITEQTQDVSEIALLLSGGVDSLSCGFAAEAIGLNVHAYTFRLNTQHSQDSRAAQKAAHTMGWEFTLIDVPTDDLEHDFLKLARRYECKKKTQFECTFPFLYVIPAIKESHVLSGIAADGHFGLSKKAMMHYKSPKDKFDSFRDSYFASSNPAGQIQQKMLIEEYGKQQIAPYLDQRIFDYFIRFSWDEINTPYQKYKTLTAYPDQFKLVGRRPHLNLQLVAGVDKAFETLLHSPLNTKKRKRVMDLCRDYANE